MADKRGALGERVTPAGEKISTKLRDRLQIDAALRRLLSASSETDLRRQVRAIAGRGKQVIPSLVAALDRAGSRTMVPAIGLVAAQLDPDETVDAFYQVLRQPGHTFSARSGAVTILESFLGIQVPDELRPGLVEMTEATVSSLGATLEQGSRDPMVLAGAVQDLDRQEPDVVLAVVDALRRMGGSRPVELLRMLAQDVRAEVASAATAALGGLRVPEAAGALQSLIPAVGSDVRPLAERLLRKQQLAGVEIQPLPTASTAFRALAGPLDGAGQRQVWFVEETAGPQARQLLLLVLSAEMGVVDALEQRHVPKASLPARQPTGTWSLVRGGGVEMGLAEVTWDTGRRMVAEALDRNRETQIPLPGLLRFLSGWLWGTAVGSLPQGPLLEPQVEDSSLVGRSDLLVGHLAFSGWHPAREAAAEAADAILRRSAWEREMWVRRLAAEVLAEPGMARTLARRLRANAEWLALAGEALPARVALATAEALEGESAQQVPFLLALVRRDLHAALDWLEPSGRTRDPDRRKGDR